MNTPQLETQRLILRKFTEEDIGALYSLLSDTEVNTFLPWFPLKSIEEAAAFYKERFAENYKKACGYHYAVCLKDENKAVGYVNVAMDDSYDLGYGLCRALWHKGITTEGARAVIAQLQKDGIPYVTATHDVHNPRSGSVMKKLGMQYQYSYEERIQPKNQLITFRMYQLNLDGKTDRVYKKYWERSAVRFIEECGGAGGNGI